MPPPHQINRESGQSEESLLPIMIYTASYYDPEDWVGQAYRVSRAHPRGRKAQWETLPFLYPPRELLVRYRDGGIGFEGLAVEYREYVEGQYQNVSGFQEWVDQISSLGNFTLLCFERGEQPCHRRVLAQWLLERVPTLGLGALR